MASMQAWGSLSLASCSARTRRLFSRATHSASTSKARRSSKASAVMSAWCCCSVHAAARASSFRAWSFSRVGALSIVAPSLVVGPAADVLVDRDEGELRGRLRPSEPVEAVLQDRIDMAIGARLDGTGARASGLEPLRAIALGEAQEPQARAIALLGMGPIRENRRDERRGLSADGTRPVDEAGGRPLQMMLVGLGHVRGVGGVAAAEGTAPMGGDPLPTVEDLDGCRGQAGVDVLVQEGVGDGVVVAVDLDVVVDVDAGVDLPLAIDEGLSGQWTQRRLVQALEKFAAAGAIEPHRPSIEIRE